LPRQMCAYCGNRAATDKEHVFPRNLYPKSKANSRVKRLTIPSCNICNNGWADDEAHFRNFLALAGPPNNIRQELWETTINRGLHQIDGPRRIQDIINALQSVEINGDLRYKIYPGQDNRVSRVVKKIVRGLSHHHGIQSVVPESCVWVDIMEYQVPDELLAQMIYTHREPDIVEYRYAIVQENGIQSAWLITFFERVTFIGIIWSTEHDFEQSPLSPMIAQAEA